MADLIFAGDAALVAEVRTGTLDTYDVATTYKVTINGKVISTVGTGGTTSTTATALRALLNASTVQEFSAITWSGATNAIIGTCDTSGVTIIPVLTVSGGTGTVTDFAITTAGEGPEVVCANNFKDGTSGARSLPTNSDNVYFQDIAVDLKYNLEALSAVTVTSLHIKASYTGEIGLPTINTDLTTDYNEYRPRFFKLGATSVYIGEGGGDGSGRIMLNFGTVQTAVLVVSAADSTDDQLHAVQLRGTHASNTLTTKSGTVDVAASDDDTAVFVTVIAGGDSEVRLSRNTTHTTINVLESATVDYYAAATTLNIYGEAKATRFGSGTLTTANVSSGTFDDRGSGTVTTMNIGNGATTTAEFSPVAKTYTSTTVAGSYTLNDPNHRITFTNAIDPGKGSVLSGTLNLGNGRTILPGAP